MKRLLIASAACLMAWPAHANDLRDAVARDYDRLLGDLFVHFHRNPELSFREDRTAKRLAAELRKLGVDVTEGVGGTGLVGMIRNGDGPTVLVRADMDGLPVREQSGLDYASTASQVDITGQEMPVMHACGHDVHITALIGAAKRLMAARDRWRGTVMLVGQPAEERIGGAKAMMDDGLYDRFGRPDYALAFHVASMLPAGKIEIEPGLRYSSSDSVNIVVHGIGSHGAAPHRGKDPIVIASQIVVMLQTLVAREIPPLEPGVVTVGAFHAGSKHNIISDRAELQLTVRSDNEDVRATLLAGIKRIAENLGRAAGLPEDLLPTVELSVEATPTTWNDPDLTARVRAAIVAQMGEDALTFRPRESMGAEDFPYFTRTEPEVPGVYFAVGGTPQADFDAEDAGGPPVPAHHSPFFKIAPAPAITAGVEAMTAAVLDLLAVRAE